MNHQNLNFSWRYGSAEETFLTEVFSAPHWVLWLKPEKAKASHLGLAQKIGYVGTEVLSFCSEFSELFIFSCKCVSYFTKLFSTFHYIYAYIKKHKWSIRVFNKQNWGKDDDLLDMVKWMQVTSLSKATKCLVLKQKSLSNLQQEQLDHYRPFFSNPPDPVSFCFSRNYQNNPEGLMLKEKSWRQSHLAHDHS